MPLTSTGRDFLARACINAPGTVFYDSANAYVGVGSSTDAFDPSQTDLQAPVEKFRKKVDAGYPVFTAPDRMVFQITLGPDEANFAIREWAVFNAPAGGTMLHREVTDTGTKQQGQSWTFRVTVDTNYLP
ncbi:hypothetical protein D3C75_233000 [compost metagenome]